MFAEASDRPSRFGSSRSVVCGTRGMAATSQPLAAYEAIRVLEDGGNAIDAAVTASILLGILEPMQIGLGGDVLALVHDGRTGETHALNGSGRAGSGAQRGAVVDVLGVDAMAIPIHSIHAVTVPGAVDGWLGLLDRFGRTDRARAFAPAIRAAEQGFAVAPQTAATWAMGAALVERHPASQAVWLLNGKAPRAGETFRNPAVARHLRLIVEGGRDAFYAGPGAAAIVKTVTELGGFLTAKDFRTHSADWVEPMTARYRDCTVMEMPPNSQGVAVLEALALLDRGELKSRGFGSADAVRLQIEAVCAAMADSNAEVADASHLRRPANWFLDPTRLDELWQDIEGGQRSRDTNTQSGGGDTAFVAVADHEGSFAAVIGSLFMPWATGITAGASGILLQNRGAGFSLDPGHPNVIAPGKRPRHTILPALLFMDDHPVMAMGFVGGDMQVQAQVQFLCNLLDFGMNPQEALDAPRWRHEGRGGEIALEHALACSAGDDLARAGYDITGSGGFFGGGQAVLRHPELETLQGVSDGRRDGAALGL